MSPSNAHTKQITYSLRDAPAVKSPVVPPKRRDCVRTRVSISTSARNPPQSKRTSNTIARNTSLTICVMHQPSRTSTAPPVTKGVHAHACQHFENAHTPNPPQSKRASKTRRHLRPVWRTNRHKSVHRAPETKVARVQVRQHRKIKECVRKSVSNSATRSHTTLHNQSARPRHV
jgi:hypothetical protein